MKEVFKVLAVFAGTILTFACVVLSIQLCFTVDRLTRPQVHELTSPLAPGVIQNLCQKLDLAEGDPLCQPGATAYAPDFFPAVRASFEPGITTYDDVQGKLGRYLYKREPLVIQADGTRYFVCRYDFKGDRVFPVVFFFTGEGVLKRIFATISDN